MTPADALSATAVALLLGCLLLLESVRRGARRAGLSLSGRQGVLTTGLEELQARVERLESELEEVKEAAAVLVPPEPPRSGLNLARRSEALRRLRKGESPSLVAAALSISTGEAELLGKVQRMLVAVQTGDAEQRPRLDVFFTGKTGPDAEPQPAEAEPERASARP